MATFSAKAAEVDKKWVMIDAKGLVVGRLASIIAMRLRGQHKPTYTPHVDDGDCVVVVNAKDVVLTGRKVEVGNFSVLPWTLLERLVGVSEIWNHYAAAVYKARFPLVQVPVPRKFWRRVVEAVLGEDAQALVAEHGARLLGDQHRAPELGRELEEAAKHLPRPDEVELLDVVEDQDADGHGLRSAHGTLRVREAG